ncbi:AAA family ATPase [Vibrio sp. 1733]|uniref:AAA family ATPase n=1 Tax=Vibrio TaxID=662 RepID=UPI0029657173|nr:MULTISPECIES: AAA family ATPase [unclassified Vibrio]MDW2184560.1 AAA family ATPase [Vibrio sp. 1733]MDW2234294.1 AAA family ATPase [Vibrio sp. 1565-1]
MSIEYIEVNGLFGAFNHRINFKEGGITILLGENGLGKTVFLEMIEHFFSLNTKKLSEVEFENLLIKYKTGEIWNVVKDYFGQVSVGKVNPKRTTWYNISQLKKSSDGTITHKENDRSIDHYLPKDDYENLFLHPNSKNLKHHYFSQKKGSVWFKTKDKKTFTIVTSDGLKKAIKINENEQEKIPLWLSKPISEISPKIIETQRIISLHRDRKSEYLGRHPKSIDSSERTPFKKTIHVCQDELKNTINEKILQSNQTSSTLDSTFPNRIMRAIRRTREVDIEDIENNLNKLNEKRHKYSQVGLISQFESNDISLEKKQDAAVYHMIEIYIDDSNKKLSHFNRLYEDIKLFISIINERLKHKTLTCCQDTGFKVVSTIAKDEEGQPKLIPVDKLSSGEQHEIILFYKLIFEFEKNSLILIDEPELSLHISWQNKFIDDIKKVIDKKEMTTIIATHSPDIIGTHWDLTCELVGVDE